jgi:hypothetical protein
VRSVLFKIFFLLLVNTSLIAQDLLPFVENYSKSDYQGDNQIWNVAQGTDKAMYFANNHYFLRYNGVRWEKYMLPNKTIIRSIFVSGDRIYSGSYKEFGYWRRVSGKMKYFSLSEKKRVFDDTSNEEIWKIFKYNNEIYFQAFNEIFVFNGKSIREIKLPFQISYGFQVGNDLLLASTTQGVYKLRGKTFEKVTGGEILQNHIVHHIQEHGGSTYYFTQKDGVYVEMNGVFSAWRHPLNETLKTAIINVARFVDGNKLIIGTASNGVYIVNLSDNSVTGINRDNIMMNNSVLSIGLDSESDLWLGLDNGIAHIELRSPVSIFSDNSGILGSVYSISADEPAGYLIASNHGLFRYQNQSLELIPDSQGQAWNITKLSDTHLVGHNEGTFTYTKNKFLKLNAVNGGWNFTKSSTDNSFLQSTYCGVVVYPDIKNLSVKHEIKGLCKPIKYAAQNRKNEIWAADNYRGLYRILIDDNYTTRSIVNVSQENNIHNDFGIKLFEFRNEILFLINGTWYTYNSIIGRLEKNALFNDRFSGISDIAAIDDNNFVILQDGLLFTVFANGNKFMRNLIHEKYYAGKIINDNIKIYKERDQFLLNLDDGFIAVQLRQEAKSAIPKITVEALYNNELHDPERGIKYNTGLRLNVLSGYYGSSKPFLFYRLNNQKRFNPIKNGSILLNNLNSGKQAVTIYIYDGSTYREAATFNFVVLKPWYFSGEMILLYILLTGIAFFLYYKWNKIRYTEKLKLREEELKHQKSILEFKLKAENELNIQQYEKHILELEVQTKSSEVAGKSLSIAKQGEIIESIQHILDSENDLDRLKNEIRKAIKINAVNKHEWEIFESNLSQIHNEFSRKLTAKYPTLTSRDVKLSIYLKMNLSSKEIAPLMNISFRGVELQRYRLRKKLGLQADESLYKFMTSL